MEFFSTKMWYVVVMVVEIKVFFPSTYVIILRSCEFEVDDTVEGKDNKEEGTNEDTYIRICPNFAFGISQKSLVYNSSLLASFSSFSTLILSLVSHCFVKHLKVSNISTADHIPALIEECSYYWSDTTWCQRPSWTPSPSSSCRPQTQMTLILLEMLNETGWTKFLSTFSVLTVILIIWPL